ncbi:MAG: ABC transporter substrate-binding protein [Burkholderiaceae bacterium]|nr:ABC transporter substrate-binding protein [Burkholderiaceae bacterium]
MKRSIGAGLLAISAAVLWVVPAAAQEVTLTILSHKVHENVSRGLVPGTTGGDVAGEWAARNGVKLNWVTANIEPMHDRLFRELSLRETSVDLAFVINKFQVPKISKLLEPLDARQAEAPIEDLGGIPANLLEADRYNGVLTGIPFRHATTGLHWNTVLFKEKGLDRAPRTADEVADFARKLTYTRSDGTRVNGLIFNSGDEHLSTLQFLNMYGAVLIDGDMKVRANSPQMIRGLTELAKMYKDGVLPTNYASVSIDDVIGAVQSGRAAMAIDPFARFTVYNNPKAARDPGAVHVAVVPADPSTGRQFTALTEIWSMVIPKNSKHKELAWSLIRELSKPENTVRIALNGNGPVRPAAYSDERLKKQLPYTAEEAKAIAEAQIIPSGFDESLRALAIFREESQAAVIGLKTPQAAAESMQKRLEPLVHSK